MPSRAARARGERRQAVWAQPPAHAARPSPDRPGPKRAAWVAPQEAATAEAAAAPRKLRGASGQAATRAPAGALARPATAAEAAPPPPQEAPPARVLPPARPATGPHCHLLVRYAEGSRAPHHLHPSPLPRVPTRWAVAAAAARREARHRRQQWAALHRRHCHQERPPSPPPSPPPPPEWRLQGHRPPPQRFRRHQSLQRFRRASHRDAWCCRALGLFRTWVAPCRKGDHGWARFQS